MSKTQKELWRKEWLSSLKELTSLELQKKSWLDKKNTNPHWSFIEFISCYFDDLMIDNNYKIPLENNWITEKELLIIQNWHNLLDKYEPPKNDNYNHYSILKDKNWLKIVEKGIEEIEQLIEVLNKEEIEFLNEDISYQ